MARPVRIEYADAIYHVTSRGNERGRIVRDEKDRDRWLEWAQRAVAECGWRVFAFALMENHYHLFLQTPEANLSVGMRLLNGGYAGYFNARHRRSGHVFQGRFKGIVVEDEGHWLELSRYIHLNPVRVRLVARPEEWKWSSYRGYHWPRQRLEWIDYERVLSEFGGDNARSIRAYRAYMEEGLEGRLDSPLVGAVHQMALGSREFVNRIGAKLKARGEDVEMPELRKMRVTMSRSVEEVAAVVARQFGADMSRWQPGHRSDDIARAVAAYVSCRVTGLSKRQIAEALGYRRSQSVSVACQRVERAMRDGKFAKVIKELTRRVCTNY